MLRGEPVECDLKNDTKPEECDLLHYIVTHIFLLCWVYIYLTDLLSLIYVEHGLHFVLEMMFFFGGNAQTLDWFFYEDCSLLYWRLPIDKWGRIGVTALSVETVYWWLHWRESGDYFEGCVLLEGCLGFILLTDIKIEDRLIYADWYIC